MITVEINNQVKVPQRFETLFNLVAKRVNQKFRIRKNLTISVAFVSPYKIKKYNKKYRGLNKVTDVLSFPEINEILICYQRAASQARQLNQSLKKHLLWLFVHGLLHLLGYNHQTKSETKIMRGLESEFLKSG